MIRLYRKKNQDNYGNDRANSHFNASFILVLLLYNLWFPCIRYYANANSGQRYEEGKQHTFIIKSILPVTHALRSLSHYFEIFTLKLMAKPE